LIAAARILAFLSIAAIAACEQASDQALPDYLELSRGWRAPDYLSYDWSAVEDSNAFKSRSIELGAAKIDPSCLYDDLTSVGGTASDADVRQLMRSVSQLVPKDPVVSIVIVGRTAQVVTGEACAWDLGGTGLYLWFAQDDQMDWVLKKSGMWIS
jgi:hypothetical protein